MFRRSKGKAPLYNSNGNDSNSGRLSREMPVRQPSTIDITEGIREMILDDDNATRRATTPVEPTFPFKNKSVARGSLYGPTQSGDPTARATTPAGPSAKVIHTFDHEYAVRVSLEKSVHSETGVSAPLTRPKLKQSMTAPGAVTDLFSVVPEPPRRAISARTTRPLLMQDTRSVRSSPAHSALPRAASLPRTPTYRSFIGRHKVNRRASGRLGIKPRGSIWRFTPGLVLRSYESISKAIEDRQHSSFSKRSRVQETLEHKRMDFLKTDIVDFKDRDLPDTPSSLLSTPRELYRMQRKGLDPLPEQGKIQPPKPSPKAERSCSLPQTQSLKRTEIIIRGTSILSPDKVPWVPHVYVPGPIRLATTIPGMRKGSVASLEPFVGEVEQLGDSRRFSDNIVVDGIVAYFLGLGVMDLADEECVDRFWEAGDVGDSDASGSEALGAPCQRTSTPPIPVRSPILSSPSSKYASAPVTLFQPLRQQDTSPMPPAQQQRQRVGLRRLLQSASSII
ncbi:hypothetical protein BDV96DRAFT_597267 [Lophiotrema nucula]|uniref:Uncharacterized protein n=1 Tax=Lophiotrema nucula TaxID=690887 RepID=A0A6A5ZJL4_9PLEO|nr:hypothetical protein BDV96DRAFT_597267 [Lophiotrema nucula]